MYLLTIIYYIIYHSHKNDKNLAQFLRPMFDPRQQN